MPRAARNRRLRQPRNCRSQPMKTSATLTGSRPTSSDRARWVRSTSLAAVSGGSGVEPAASVASWSSSSMTAGRESSGMVVPVAKEGSQGRPAERASGSQWGWKACSVARGRSSGPSGRGGR